MKRKIILELDENSPAHQPIIEWLDNLPKDGRGVRYKNALTRLLIQAVNLGASAQELIKQEIPKEPKTFSSNQNSVIETIENDQDEINSSAPERLENPNTQNKESEEDGELIYQLGDPVILSEENPQTELMNESNTTAKAKIKKGERFNKFIKTVNF